MSKLQYTVTTVYDDPETLNSNQISRDGGRIVSVIWTPARTTKRWLKEPGVWESGYTIIAESGA